ncbi:MAG: dTDP-glucose 4,6-dehydratase [Phycisphaerales bacterium]|nr:dTDP-glucose 4,6-dehydratase [Phycisphaerales bacterium]
MRNVLVTGGAGFIGSNFVRYLLRAEPDARVVNLDALTYAGSRENLRDLPGAERHVFVHGDIRDRERVGTLMHAYSVDSVVHFAAESHVDRSITGPAAFIDTNINGTFVLLEAARAAWLDGTARRTDVRFHHVSTDEVFGSLGPGEPAFTEQTPYRPNSPYSASKAASDHLVRAYGHTYGLPLTISNCSNNYGPFQFPEKLIPLMILNAVRGKPLPVYGDGLQVRDWLHVEDHCEAIHAILRRGRPGETYNVGGNNQPTNLEIVRTICGLLDERFPDSPHRPHERLIRFVTDRPGHDRRYAMDISKIGRELGWSPRHSLADGLRDTIDWYLAHPDWLAAIDAKGEFQSWLAQNYATRGTA